MAGAGNMRYCGADSTGCSAISLRGHTEALNESWEIKPLLLAEGGHERSLQPTADTSQRQSGAAGD